MEALAATVCVMRGWYSNKTDMAFNIERAIYGVCNETEFMRFVMNLLRFFWVAFGDLHFGS